MKKKLIIIPSIVVATGLLLVFFAVFPLLKIIKNYSQSFADFNQKTVLFEKKIIDFKKSKESYQLCKTELEKIDLLFVDPEVPVEFIKFLEESARQSGIPVVISNISLKSEKQDVWNSMGFHISFAGSFPDILKFIQKTETGNYLIKIENFSVRKLSIAEISAEKGLSSGDVKGVLTIKVYTK